MARPLAASVARRIRRSTTAGPVFLAVVVGLSAAAGAVVLRQLIRGVQWLAFDGGVEAAAAVGVPDAIVTVAAPAIGMVAVAAMVRAWAPEARGHGVPEVQAAVRMQGGRIRPRVAVVKAVASAVSIGTGGSVGREGPIVQIGSGLGSSVAQWIGLGADEVRILVAAGAAGAIGATFNAPIAGVIFALEVILGSFAARSFGLVVIASVTATAAAQAVLGTEPAFRLIEQFTLVSQWEYALYPVLGVATGGIALVYVRAVYGFEDAFDQWRAPWVAKAVTGGLLVGLLGTFGSTHLFGVGHEGVELALAGELATVLMVILVALKILATSLTLAAGGSGGVFAPALFIGAMAGGAFGRVAGQLLPTVTAPAGAYALVGAAAVFGAATHAPITAIIILFEMTDNYRIILPLMLAVVLAQLVASRLDPDSIYSIKLRRSGGMARPPEELGTLDMLLVADAMVEEVPVARADEPLTELLDRARSEPTRSWVVEDGEGGLVGVVALADLERCLLEGSLAGRVAADAMTRAVVTCAPAETLRSAFVRFGERDVHLLPVVDPAEPTVVLGVLRRAEMMWAFKELADEHVRLAGRAGLTTAGAGGSVHAEVAVAPSDRALCFRRVREVEVPEHALIALLRRGDRAVVPRGFTRIEPGDVLTVISTREHERELAGWLEERREASA